MHVSNATPSLHGVRVLLVEDDADTLALFAAVLENEGALVARAADGRAAVDAYVESPPDVVISDIGLPEVDGHALIRYLRRVGLSAPSIAVTARAAPEDRFRSAQMGFDLHLTKPVEPEVLLRAVRQVLASGGGQVLQ